MPLSTPLLPVMTLLLGAVVLPLTRRILRARVRDGLALAATGTYLLATVLTYLDQPTAVTVYAWEPAPHFGVQLGYYADNLSLLFASLIGFVMLVTILSQSRFLAPEGHHTPRYGAIFLVAAGGISLIFAADLVTLCLSWGLLDLGLVLLTALLHRGKAASRAGLGMLVVGYLASLALLASLLLLEGSGASFSLQTTLLPSRVISLIMLAALMRLGLYPPVVALPTDVEMSVPTVTVWYAIPLASGGYLAARMLSLASVTSLPGKEVALFLGSLVLVLSPFPLWFETNLRRVASYIALHQVGYVILASAMTGPYSVAIVSTQVISLTLALSLLFLRHAASRHPMPHHYHLWIQSCTLAAIAALVGTPLTLAFVGRWVLYLSLWESGLAPLVVLTLVANSLLLAPLLKMSLERTPQPNKEGELPVLLLGGITILGIPLVILGLHPPLLGSILSPQGALSTLPALPDLISLTEPSRSVALLGGILASLSLGYLMYRWGELIVSRAGIFMETFQQVAEMDWFGRALSWTVQRVALVLELLGGFFEDRRSPGWILLFALLVTLLLLSS